LKCLPERCHSGLAFPIVGRCHQQPNPPHPLALLRARRERPRGRRAAEQRDEIAAPQLVELHSISNSPRQMQDIELAMVSQRVYDHALARARAR
jgi:hypothetical protein